MVVEVTNPQPGTVTVSNPAPAAVTVDNPQPSESVTVSNLSPSDAVTVGDQAPLTVAVGNQPGTNPVDPRNLVVWMIDDASRSLMSFHADQNRWPAGFRYASLPFLEGLVATTAMRCTNFRVNARCAPTRASLMTSLLAPITSPQSGSGWTHLGRPWGTGIGDVEKQTPSPPVDGDWWLGLMAEHRPWPTIARLAGAPHSIAHFGKWHLFPKGKVNVGLPNEQTVDLNQRSIVDIGGFDRSVYIKQSGAGEPAYGYKDYDWEITEQSARNDSSGNGGSYFSPNLLYDEMVAHIDTQFALGKPIMLNIWNNLPHGLPGAIDPLDNQWSEVMHTFDYEELIPNVGGSDPFGGTVAAGDPRGGYTAAGVFDGTSEYTQYGAVPVFHQRVTSLLEIMDFFTKKIHDYIIGHPSGLGVNTTFMHFSDNGTDPLAITPIETTMFSGLGGVEFSNCYPPTVDGTVTGARFHDEEDAKGSIKDEGILSHLLIWGAGLDESLEGTDCDALLSALDFAPTVLDLLVPGQWPSWYGSDYDHLEGNSFAQRLQDGGLSPWEYSYHAVQKPGWVADETVTVTQFDRCVVWDDGAGQKYKFRSIYEAGVITKDYQLFDLNADPGETTDLIPGNTDPGITAIISQLSTVYFTKFGLV